MKTPLTFLLSLLMDFILLVLWVSGYFLVLIGFLVALSACAYTLYIWWGVISDLEFISFILSIFLFFLSIPLSPFPESITNETQTHILTITHFSIRVEEHLNN